MNKGTIIVIGAAAAIVLLVVVFGFVLPQGNAANAALFVSDLNKTRQIENASILFFTAYGQTFNLVINKNGTKILSEGANGFDANLTQVNAYYMINGIAMDCLHTYPKGFPNDTSKMMCIKWPPQILGLMRTGFFPTSLPDVFNPISMQINSSNATYYDSITKGLSYSGVKNVSGRRCDYFSYANPQANPPMRMSICLDSQYGIIDSYNNTLLGGSEIRLGGFRMNLPENVTLPRIGIYVSNAICSENQINVELMPLVNITNATIRTTIREGSTLNYSLVNVTTAIDGKLSAWRTYSVLVNPGHALNISQESLKQIGGLGFCAGEYCGNGGMFETSCS